MPFSKLGAALAAMVCNLTHAKPKLHAAHEQAEEIAVRAQTLKDDLMRAAEPLGKNAYGAYLKQVAKDAT